MRIPTIKQIYIVTIICSLFISFNGNASINVDKENPKILVFSKTGTFRHKSIPTGISTLKKMGKQQHWDMEFSEDSLLFNNGQVDKYQLIIFLNTTGTILDATGKKAFENYIKQGGNFVGIHSATDTEFEWPFYEKMIGAQFESHPKQQTASLNVQHNTNHPSIKHYDKTFELYEEWYNFKKPVIDAVTVLIDVDESTYQGGTMDNYHPISWYQFYEGGRIFYTAMGHREETYSNAKFLKHLEEGIKWTLNESEISMNKQPEQLLDSTLSKWDVWMGAVHTSVDLDVEKFDNVQTGTPLGLNNDPKHVFSVIEENGEQILHITGEIYGGLTTKNEYGNYHLSTEFKWGDKKWEPRLNDKRDSGILYHAKGPHGVFWNVWMSSLEFQVQEGDCGDFIALGDVYGDVPSDKKINKKGNPLFIYNPKGTVTPLKYAKEYESGRASKSTLYEKRNGEWNTLEIYVLRDESIHLVNGHVVNRVKNARYDVGGKTVPAVNGKIQIQSEAAEIYYKNIKISPITKLPSKFKDL